MGLDQWAYIASCENTKYDDTSRQELSYWRKHPNLQGWMENLWIEKGCLNGSVDIVFNGIELELKWEDIDRLEKDIKNGIMSTLDTVGFFFGEASDDHYQEQDLEFCLNAKVELFLGRRVFYISSW
jgi:hypothetical protein